MILTKTVVCLVLSEDFYTKLNVLKIVLLLVDPFIKIILPITLVNIQLVTLLVIVVVDLKLINVLLALQDLISI